jgi:hypothetical protein
MPAAKRTSGRQAVVPRRGKSAYITIGANTADLIEDPLQVLEWDDEELRRGQKRNSLGRFTGEPPKIIPRIVYDELIRRTIDTCLETMRENMPAMIETLVTIASDPGIEPKDRIKAIDLMMNRIFGKPKERVQVEFGRNEKPLWEKALDVAVVNSSDDEEPFE